MKLLITILMIAGMSIQLQAEDFAVVQNEHVDLINREGKAKLRLQRGAVVKVRNHRLDPGFYTVFMEGNFFSAPKNSFREVSSVFQEERRLLNQIDSSQKKVKSLENQLSKLNESKTLINKRINELQIWIEVQRDLSFSRDFFIRKTKGSFEELNKLQKDLKEKNSDSKLLKEELFEEELKLKTFQSSFETLQTKLKALKKEKRFTDQKYVEVQVIAQDTPVFLYGKIVDYLTRNTTIKVKKDHTLKGWYVFYKNRKPHYIASSDVAVSQI